MPRRRSSARAAAGSWSKPVDIPIGRLAIVEDPFGNRLVLLDATKGRYHTAEDGTVVGVA
jgi:hypothetical protein